MRPFPLLALLPLLSFLSLLAAPAAATVYHDYYGPYGDDEWISWEEDWRENEKAHATPPFQPRWEHSGCYIAAPEKTLIEDLDCDKVPDPIDNCLGLANPTQADQNQNGLGDHCDLVVDSIALNPGVVLEGRAFTAEVTLTNYRPYELRNLQLTIQAPELGLEQRLLVDSIGAGSREERLFSLRLPDCVEAREYDLVLLVEFPQGPGLNELFHIPTRLRAESSGRCSPSGSTAGRSIINILELQDIDEEGGIYPFTIVNAEERGQAYVLTIDGVEEWGAAEIRPRSLLVVPAGESREGEIVVYAKEGASGQHSFLLTVRSQADAHQELLAARIAPRAPDPDVRRWLQFGLFAAATIIIVAAFGLTFHRLQRERTK